MYPSEAITAFQYHHSLFPGFSFLNCLCASLTSLSLFLSSASSFAFLVVFLAGAFLVIFLAGAFLVVFLAGAFLALDFRCSLIIRSTKSFFFGADLAPCFLLRINHFH